MLKERLAKASKPKLDFTFLTEEQILGDEDGNGQLDVMKRYGTKVAPTDLTVLLGGHMTDNNDRTSEGDLTCQSWSASSHSTSSYLGVGVRCVLHQGDEYSDYPYVRDVSARPVLPPPEASKIGPIESKGEDSGCQIVEYGEYPQTVADERTSEKLEERFKDNSLRLTGKNYTFDSVVPENTRTSFKAKSYPEYELDGKKYIRVLGRPHNRHSRLSTTGKVMRGKPYWVEVQPIEWLMDKSGWMVAKKCLFSGIQFDTYLTYDGNFKKTPMKKYLDTYFSREIGPSQNTADKERVQMLADLKKQLAEVSDFDKTRKGVTPAKTPERTDELAEIVRLRRASALLKPIFQKAQKEGDTKTMEAISEMAEQFREPWMKIQNKVYARGNARRAKNGRG